MIPKPVMKVEFSRGLVEVTFQNPDDTQDITSYVIRILDLKSGTLITQGTANTPYHIFQEVDQL